VSAVPPDASTPSGTVTFKDGATVLGTAGLSGGVATLTTGDLAVGVHAIAAEYSGDSDFNTSTGNLTQEVRSYEQRCGLAVTAYDFNASGPVRVDIAVLGTLDCLQVERVAGDHPQATGGIATGQYWRITGTAGLGGTASGFSVTLTLPATFVPDGNDKLCRYTGVAQVWDCAASGFG